MVETDTQRHKSNLGRDGNWPLARCYCHLCILPLCLMCNHNTAHSSLSTDLLLVILNRPIKVRDSAIVTNP